MKNFTELSDSPTFLALSDSDRVALENVGVGASFSLMKDRLDSLQHSWGCHRILIGKAIVIIRRELKEIQDVIDARTNEESKILDAQRAAEFVEEVVVIREPTLHELRVESSRKFINDLWKRAKAGDIGARNFLEI